ncbi:purine-nucleoside phosphorylase [Ensifer soli]|uniref:purine-nucleoside phosphorylase n=1 Tax=Ciceribacter sp. sgz301302 TaxID=3342379 RepID=UPI0035B895B6
MTAAATIAARLGDLRPRIALVLGSGLGSLVAAIDDPVTLPYAEIPGFPRSSVSGHAGELVAGTVAGVPVVVLSGRAHYYEHGDAGAMRVPIEALEALGVEILLLTNSAGSLREEIAPGTVMQISDHINFSGTNPLIGIEGDERFVGMTSAYDPGLGEAMRQAAARAGIALSAGVYMWFSGPSFETPAEIRMARLLGADAVGMSTVPEVLLARYRGLRVAAASVITNYGAGMTGAELSHHETKDMAPVGGARLAAILKEMLKAGL